jgi:hypothetical protein
MSWTKNRLPSSVPTEWDGCGSRPAYVDGAGVNRRRREDPRADQVDHHGHQQRRDQHEPQPGQPADRVVARCEVVPLRPGDHRTADPKAAEREEDEDRLRTEGGEGVRERGDAVVLDLGVVGEHGDSNVAQQHRQSSEEADRVDRLVWRRHQHRRPPTSFRNSHGPERSRSLAVTVSRIAGLDASAPRVGVEPTSLILIQSQAGPAGRPTGE